MKEDFSNNFGLLIAYLIPGFVTLWGVGQLSPTVRLWLGSAPPDAPTVAGLLYVTLASTASGLVVSAVRWAVVDRAFRLLGVTGPAWDFSRFGGRVAAFEALVENHYRYYQFYANTLVAAVFTYGVSRLLGELRHEPASWVDAGFALVSVVLIVGSWDTLRKYDTRVRALLGTSGRSKRGG